MELENITEHNIKDAWDLFQGLMKEQETQKFVKIDLDNFKGMFLTPQLTTVKGIIGYEDGIPIALITYCYSFTVYRGQPVLTFKTFYIIPPHRKKGYGRQLLRHLIKEAEAQNCAYIQWSVYDQNSTAKSYYASMELKSDDELLNYLVTPAELTQKIGV